ncbi:hypothetical protein KTJ87_17775 [Rhodobacteraceae bacterium ASV31]|nr:hypothetical protein [Anianabacter salinae]
MKYDYRQICKSKPSSIHVGFNLTVVFVEKFVDVPAIAVSVFLRNGMVRDADFIIKAVENVSNRDFSVKAEIKINWADQPIRVSWLAIGLGEIIEL